MKTALLLSILTFVFVPIVMCLQTVYCYKEVIKKKNQLHSDTAEMRLKGS